MAGTEDNWSSNANEALTVSLVVPSSDVQLQTISSFHPKFTYPIFGEEEQIFGYRGLKINLRYNATDMRPHLSKTFSKKFRPIGETEPTDVEELLRPFLPAVAYQRSKEFEQAITSLPESWTPPGEKVEVVQTPIQNKTFEVWRGSLADPGVKQLVSRIQILVSFFIEGGTPIDLDQPDADRWTVFFLYTKHTDPTTKREVYMFAGYCTTYRFYLYLPPTPPASPGQESNGQPAPKDDLDLGDGNFDLSQLPCRSRISQFIIVPPFQKLGVGSAFYSVIFKQYQKHPQTVEITVEDPNEAFDDMRDLSDLAYLRTVSNFLNLRINTSLKLPKAGGPVPKNIVDPEAYETLRRRVKIAPRQFARVLEMHLMSRLPHSVRPEISEIDAETPPPKPKPTRAEQHEYDLWKLLVKARLYRQHRDILGQLEHKERVEKLEETCASVEFEYARLLDKVEAWNKRTGGDLENGGKGKRKADEAPEEEPGSGRKKARFEDA